MSSRAGRRRILPRALWILVVALAGHAAHAADDGVEARLQRLEQQMQQVLDALHARGIIPAPTANTSAPAAPVATTPATTVITPPASAPVARVGGEANIRYYISEAPLGLAVPAAAPLASGRIALDDQIGLHPRAYNASAGGMFSAYRDPSRYRSAGLWLEAALPISQAGKYTLSVVTQPAREGGSSVSTTMTARLWLDDRLILDVQPTGSWRTWSASLELAPGSYRVRLWFNSVSPGFGPTPLDSSLRLKLQRPGDAAPVPLTRLLSLPVPH